MTLTIDLPPELERRLQEEAERRGQAPAEYVRDAVAEKLTAARKHSNQTALALLRQWRAEDADNPDPQPPPVIPPLSLLEVEIG